jgi:hemoglobin
VMRLHSGNGEHQEMDERAQRCFAQALVDIGLTNDDRLRSTLEDYFVWAIKDMSTYPHSAADVPANLDLPHWSWDGPQQLTPDSQSGSR